MNLKTIVAGSALGLAAACAPPHFRPAPVVYVEPAPVYADCFTENYWGYPKLVCYDYPYEPYIALRFGLYTHPRFFIRPEPYRFYQPRPKEHPQPKPQEHKPQYRPREPPRPPAQPQRPPQRPSEPRRP